MTDDLFEPAPHSRKIRCTVCGSMGYQSGRWMDAHLAGHPYSCPDCPRVFAKAQGLSSHRRTHTPSDDYGVM